MDTFWQKLWDNKSKPWTTPILLALSLWRAYQKENIAIYARALVYVTLLTLVPLLAVAFALLQGFGLKGIIEPWLSRLFEPMGASGQEVVGYLLEFVSQTNADKLGIIGICFLFYSVINIAQNIEQSLQNIWQIEQTRTIKSRITGYFTAVFLIPIGITGLFSLMLGIQNLPWLKPYLDHQSLRVIVQLITSGFPLIIFLGLLSCLYAWIPNCHVKWRAAIAGALFFLFLWIPITKLFTLFISGSRNYSVIYSSFATIIILLIWLQFLWLIFLFGAKFSYLIQYPHARAPDAEKKWRIDEQYKMALLIHHTISTNFCQNAPPLTANQISTKIDLNLQKTQELLEEMNKKQIIIQTENKAYTLAKPIENYQLKDLQALGIETPEPLKHSHPELHAHWQKMQELSLAATPNNNHIAHHEKST